MKTYNIKVNRLWIALAIFAMGTVPPSCRSERLSRNMDGAEGNKQTQPSVNSEHSDSDDAHQAAIDTPHKYGPEDADGFPLDPGFAMNSNQLLEKQRADLRNGPPKEYQVTTLSNPRHINHKDDQIEWRSVKEQGNLAMFLDSIGAPDKVPEGLYPEDKVIYSPSGNRMLIVVDSVDRGMLYEKKSSGWDMSRRDRVRSVTFDDKWRWFITWECFVTDSLLVGVSITDDEIESYPEQHRLYTYNIDNARLTRIHLPASIQPKGYGFFQIEAVSSGAILLRLGYKEGRTDDLFTVYLEANDYSKADK